MIIVLKQDAPKEKVHEFCTELEGMGLQINDSKGSDTHILGLIGDTKALAESWVLANPVVETCRRVSEPYKKANRKFHPDDSVIDVEGVKIGGKLVLSARKLTVSAQLDKLPDELVIDVTPLGVGKTIFVGDLNFDGVKFLTPATTAVCAVRVTRASRGADAAAAK